MQLPDAQRQCRIFRPSCQFLKMRHSTGRRPEVDPHLTHLAPVLHFRQMHVFCVAKLRPCIKFREQRAAHADRVHLADRVEAGADIVIDNRRTRRLRQVLDVLQQTVAAPQRQQAFAFQYLHGNGTPLRKAVIGRHAEIEPLAADREESQGRLAA